MEVARNSDLHTLMLGNRAPVRIAQTVTLAASVETVFAVVSDHTHLCALIPNLHQAYMNLGKSGGKAGVGMVRCCDFGNDMWIQETIVHWAPPFAYAYCIAVPNPFGLTDHFALVNCRPVQTATRLTWQQRYHHADLNAMNALMASLMDGLVMNLNRHFHTSPVQGEIEWQG